MKTPHSWRWLTGGLVFTLGAAVLMRTDAAVAGNRLQAEGCGRCHEEALKGYAASAHGLKARGSDRITPECNGYRFLSFPYDLGAETFLRADTLALTDNAAVDTWQDSLPMGLVFRASGTGRPTYQTNEVNGRAVLRFDGIDDAMSVTSITPSWEVPGGFTCTGLVASADGSLYVGDFDTGDIVRVSTTGTLIQRITTPIPARSIQGVAIDTSDGTFWCVDAINDLVYHLNANGTEIANFRPGYALNGIAYDANDDSLWVLQSGGTSIRRYDAATFTLQTALATSVAEPDGIVVESATRLLVSQDGTGYRASAVLRINNSTGATVDTINMPSINNIEHIAINPDGHWYIAVDDLYHSSVPKGNRIYRTTSTGQFIGGLKNVGGVTLLMVRKCLVNPTAGRTMFTYSTGKTGTSARAALLLGLTSGKPSLVARCLDADSAATVTAATSVSTANFEIQTAVINYSTSDAYLYINGVLDGSRMRFSRDGNTSDTTPVNVLIGTSAFSTFANMDLGDIIMIPRVLTADELTYLHREVGEYYSITVP